MTGILDTAKAWIGKGRSVIPIPYKTKRPVLADWPNLRITAETASQYFNGAPSNLGLLLGEPSAGIVDVDLDTDAAVAAAGYFLPDTYLYGRERRPGSHRLYACAAATTRKWQHNGTMLLELRATGCQSLIPPSVHPDGDAYVRDPIVRQPAAEIALEVLLVALNKTAAAALIAQHWSGARHAAALALAGALLHAGWAADNVETFVEAVATAAGDEELGDRVRAARDTARDHAAGKPVTGWPTLAEHLPADVLERAREWLGVKAFPELVADEATPDTAAVAKLAKLGPLQYDRERAKVAEQLGVSVTALDAQVKQARKTQAEPTGLFREIEPCVELVNGGVLLTAIAAEIRRYIVLPEHGATAAALWVLHTHAVEAAHIAPILVVTSPQKRCGKSNLMATLNAMVRRGLMVSNLSLAALYRAVDAYKPTLLVDEADTFLDDNEELRGLINAGHSRSTARTLRVGGENRNELEVFDSFGPKAISGIGARKDTIVDRSISIHLRRRTKDERVAVLRQDRLDYSELQGRCAGWAEQNMAALKAADPAMPPALHDRAADNWRPLLAIADRCGWGAKARAAAIALTGTDADESAGAMLLEDLHQLFADRGVDRLSSTDIVDALVELEERPWPEWKRGKQITQRQLARLLAPFRIAPKKLRVGAKTANGYLLEQFADSFSRYISADSSGTPEQINGGATSSPISSGTRENHVPDRSGTGTERVPDQIGLQANGGADCSGVPDRTEKNRPTEKGPPLGQSSLLSTGYKHTCLNCKGKGCKFCDPQLKKEA